MADIREQILSRLLAIGNELKTAGDVVYAARNEVSLDDDAALPAFIVLDADEMADDADPRARPSNAPRRVTLTPQIVIALQARSESVGTELNTLRRRVIKAILGDAVLSSHVGANGSIRYEGGQTDLGVGRAMTGQMAMTFAITYVLRFSDL